GDPFIQSHGGGVEVKDGTATITASTVDNNLADYGGGLAVEAGSATVTSCTFALNSAYGASTFYPGGGGGIDRAGGSLEVRYSTIAFNGSPDKGGGILNELSSVVTLTSTLIGDNTAAGSG